MRLPRRSPTRRTHTMALIIIGVLCACPLVLLVVDLARTGMQADRFAGASREVIDRRDTRDRRASAQLPFAGTDRRVATADRRQFQAEELAEILTRQQVTPPQQAAPLLRALPLRPQAGADHAARSA
jgi:hypothetical protein